MAKRAIEAIIVDYFTNAPPEARKAMLAVIKGIDRQRTRVEIEYLAADRLAAERQVSDSVAELARKAEEAAWPRVIPDGITVEVGKEVVAK